MTPEGRRLFVVLSAPSGAGKTTLCKRLLEQHAELDYSVSCTTRAPRGHEQDGVAYYFLSDKEFANKVEAGDFLEHATVHGCSYGTLRQPIEDSLRAGRDVLMDVDVQGARQIRETLASLPVSNPLREAFVDIFIAVPSMEVLAQRIRSRGENLPADIERRLRNAAEEMACAGEYQHVVVNDELDRAFAELEAILQSAREGVR